MKRDKGMMSSTRLYIITKLFRLLPETRFFALKTAFLRWAGASIGKDVHICSSVTILGQGPLDIGDHVWIGPQTMIIASAAISIGSHVDIAPRVFIGTGTHDIDIEGPRTAGTGKSLAVYINDGVWLGAASVVLAGVTIGTKSMIAAGAVVASDIPQHTMAGGVPARSIRTLE